MSLVSLGVLIVALTLALSLRRGAVTALAALAAALLLGGAPSVLPDLARPARPAAPAPSELRLVAPAPALSERVPASVGRWWPLVVAAVKQPGCEIDPLAVLAVIATETREQGEHYTPQGAPIRGAAQEVGLMQIIPAPVFPERPSVQALSDPAFNIQYGACFLAEKLRQAGAEGLSGAWRRYNGAGPQAERYARIAAGYYARYAGQPGAARRFVAPLEGEAIRTKAFGVPSKADLGGVHTGLDLASPRRADGTQPLLYAVTEGTVVHVGCFIGCQWRGPHAIVLDLGGDTYAIYSHNSEAHVQVGERVQAGQPIGRQGSEGHSTGPHLHLEIHVGAPFSGDWQTPFDGGEFIDPALVLP